MGSNRDDWRWSAEPHARLRALLARSTVKTQAELSRQLQARGVVDAHPGSVNRWLKGVLVPSAEALAAALLILDGSADDVLFGRPRTPAAVLHAQALTEQARRDLKALKEQAAKIAR
jgi:hypothetical protein